MSSKKLSINNWIPSIWGIIFNNDKKAFEKFLFALMCIVGFTFLGLFAFSTTRNQHFVELAKSFISGTLYFNDNPKPLYGYADTSYFNGKYFWPLGMFPAIILVPFVSVFGSFFRQGYISFPLTIISFIYLSKIFEKINGRKLSSLVLSFAYIFSSAYIMVGSFPFSWYFAHVVASTCLILSVYFTLVKPRPLLSGLFFSFAFLTRISVSLGVIFFLSYYFIFEKKIFIKRVVRFVIPVFFGILIFFWYNYARFGNIFETGYKYQIMGIPEIVASRDIGMWSLKHFPTNLYLFLLKTPILIYADGSKVIQGIRPSHWGMSFLFTTPVLLLILFSDIKNKLNIISLFSAFSIAIFLFGSYGLGAYQYGYRFALDFQVFLFLIIASLFKKKEMSVFTMLFIYASFLFNLYMIVAFFHPTPACLVL